MKGWGHEEKRATEDEMVGWHHQLNGHEFEQPPESSEGQGSLACCSPQGCKELDATERLNWTEGNMILHACSVAKNKAKQKRILGGGRYPEFSISKAPWLCLSGSHDWELLVQGTLFFQGIEKGVIHLVPWLLIHKRGSLDTPPGLSPHHLEGWPRLSHHSGPGSHPLCLSHCPLSDLSKDQRYSCHPLSAVGASFVAQHEL